MTQITDTDSLQRLCRELVDQPFVAVDTEFMREKTYWPRLCLVQVAGPPPMQAFAIDALAEGVDLSPLFDLLSDNRIVKVFHAGRQDIEIFHHLAGIIPAPLFDTQIAAMVCGFGDAVGYETLATKIVGAKIDKTYRFTDWSARPLSPRQIDYALDDVLHLRVIYQELKKSLNGSGRTGWLEEEEAVLLNPATYRTNPEDAWQRLKIRTNKPRFLAVLKEVAAWREREAQRRDVPRNRILRDEAVVDIAAHAPTSPDGLARTRGLADSFAKGRVGADILKAVKRGLEMSAHNIPVLAPKPDLPRDIGPIVDLLKLLLKLKCAQHDVAQKLVASTAELELLAADDSADIPALKGWRRELFGNDALAVKGGQLAIAMRGRKLRLIPADTAKRS